MVGRAVATLQGRIQRQVSKPHGHRVGRSGAGKQQRRKSAHAHQATLLPNRCLACAVAKAEQRRGRVETVILTDLPPPVLASRRGSGFRRPYRQSEMSQAKAYYL